METDRKYIAKDTRDVLEGSFDREYLLRGFWFMGTDSPIFDSLAADRFASDRANKAEKHFHIWSDMPCFCVDEDDEFNLGDYR